MSQGYFVLQPDIVFRPRQPGWSVVECIAAAVEKVIEMGVVDPEAYRHRGALHGRVQYRLRRHPYP